MSVTLAVFYLHTGLAGCLVDLKISRGERKLTRTPRVIKKKNIYILKKKVFVYLTQKYQE
jgi:hypothetical protein